MLTARFTGNGAWRKAWAPTEQAFFNEVNAAPGWRLTEFHLMYVNGSGNKYEYVLTATSDVNPTPANLENLRRQVDQYFSVYFSPANISLQSSNVNAAAVAAPVNNTAPATNNTALQNQINALQASINNLGSKAPATTPPAASNGLDKFATSLGVTTGVLAIFGVALVLVISKR